MENSVEVWKVHNAGALAKEKRRLYLVPEKFFSTEKTQEGEGDDGVYITRNFLVKKEGHKMLFCLRTKSARSSGVFVRTTRNKNELWLTRKTWEDYARKCVKMLAKTWYLWHNDLI
ncbi:MAG: hypothetical protein RSB55_04070 [Oscillospiraceae bacterium]